jgi:hypothetical protein
MSGLDGAAALASLNGLFRIENAFSLAVLFMAGPAAILTAVFLDGATRTRMFAALIAGLIATTIVVLSAGIGPKLLSFTNLNVLRIIGGIAIISIGLLIMGLNIPERLPTTIIIIGIILSFVIKIFIN